MNQRRCGALALLALAGILGGAAACSSEEAEVGPADEPELIGGRVAREGELPSTLLIKNNCTASKVGPRHILTAAHCVTGWATLSPGAKLEITNQKQVGVFPSERVDAGGAGGSDGGIESEGGVVAKEAGAGFVTVTVERVDVDPQWTAFCGSRTCGSVHVSGRNDIADVALIVVKEEFDGIPIAAVDLSPVDERDRVTVTGYGCEDAVGGTWDYSHSRLRVAETRALPFDSTIHRGSFISDGDRNNGVAARMGGLYVITPGPALGLSFSDGGADAEAGSDAAIAPDAGSDLRAGGLCPGDSGGPLYRGDAVVGVNANYTFSSGGTYTVDGISFMYGGSPVTNWHTRVDGKLGHKAGNWLRGLGVKTICSRGDC